MVYENIFWKVINIRIFYIFLYFNLNANNGYVYYVITRNANVTRMRYDNF